MTTTPVRSTTHIRKLCARLGIGWKPAHIQVQARDNSDLCDCFADVERQVTEHGGELVVGWLIWEWSPILVEAEFHAVWKSPTGELIDVSNKLDSETVVMFVQDNIRTYTVRRVDNVRIPIGKEKIIADFILKKENFFNLFEAIHGNAVGDVHLTGELAHMQTELEALTAQLLIIANRNNLRIGMH